MWLFIAPPSEDDKTAVLTGTVLDSITEEDIRTGGKVLTITLTGETWIAE